jgi:ABC-2 type transport system ATP-binding protein
VAELELVCDHLLILAAGGIRLAGAIDEMLGSHRLLTGPRSDTAALANAHVVIQESHTDRQTTMLVRLNGQIPDAQWRSDEVGLEDIVLAYLGRTTARAMAPEPPAEVAS